MKTGQIIGITAGGVVGALLLGGGAFAAGAAIGNDVRSERPVSIERMAPERQGDHQMRGEGPRDGFDRPHDAERGEGMGRGDRGRFGNSERERGEGHDCRGLMGDHEGDHDQLRQGPGHVDMDEGALQQDFSMTP